MDWFSLFQRIEASGLSMWVRESQSLLAFPAILIVHAIGMGFLVGVTAAMDFRILGFAPRIPLASLEELVPVMKLGFWLNAVTGLLLLIGFPIKLDESGFLREALPYRTCPPRHAVDPERHHLQAA